MSKVEYKILSKTDLADSALKIEVEVPFESVNRFRDRTIKELLASAELPGFRKGKVPEKIFVEQVGEFAILEKTASDALADIVLEIIVTEKIEAISRPKITVTKLAPGNPLEFEFAVDINPKIILGDYKIIAKKINAEPKDVSTVSDKEVSDLEQSVRKQLAYKEHYSKHKDDHDHNCEEMLLKTLPELTDEMIKTLGNFTSVLDFREHLKKSLEAEKIAKIKDKRRISYLEKIIVSSKISVPAILAENELSKMEAQLEHDLKQSGLELPAYLSHIKKTLDDLRNGWREEAKKRASSQLVLYHIALKEHLEPEKEVVEEEIKKIIEKHKEADKARVKNYVESVLTNEKVFEFLESQ